MDNNWLINFDNTKGVLLSLHWFVLQLNKLAPHFYLAKSQSRYLKQRKEISDGEILFLGDFAKYKFIVQDEIQSYHWYTSQCTLHPVLLYFKLENAM